MITGKLIREMRRKLGISQTELAERVGVSQAHIAKIEGEKVDPRLSLVNRIMEELRSAKSYVKCKSISTKKLIYVSPKDSIKKAATLMRRYDVSQLPVLFHKVCVGSIMESTILKNLDKDPQKLKVEEIMEESFPIIDEDSSVDVVKTLLTYHQAVLTSKRGKITGIITRSDLLKLL